MPEKLTALTAGLNRAAQGKTAQPQYGQSDAQDGYAQRADCRQGIYGHYCYADSAEQKAERSDAQYKAQEN